MAPEQLTEVEISRMRQILAQHDSQSKPMTTIDLNNPPKQPYRFQKFPMMIYDLENSQPAHEIERNRPNGLGFETVHIAAKVVSMVVQNEEQLKNALEAGWTEQAPAFGEEPEYALSAKLQNEAERVQSQIDSVKRGPGRPRKEV
jgi:hypothetical protein